MCRMSLANYSNSDVNSEAACDTIYRMGQLGWLSMGARKRAASRSSAQLQ